MNTRNIGYWVSTGLLGLAFAAGGIIDLTRSPEVVEGMRHLGYPAYLATLLGGWKVLGALAVLAPGLPRLKEWAYAGIAFDLTGAAFSHLSVGDEAAKVVIPLVLLGVAVTSWTLRPANRTLQAQATGESLRPGALGTPHAA